MYNLEVNHFLSVSDGSNDIIISLIFIIASEVCIISNTECILKEAETLSLSPLFDLFFGNVLKLYKSSSF